MNYITLKKKTVGINKAKEPERYESDNNERYGG